MATSFIVSLFYCFDALYGERSIPFWKSLPVSDLTAVLAKASIPMLIVPLLTFAITIATELMMLLLSSVLFFRTKLHALHLGGQGLSFAAALMLLSGSDLQSLLFS